MTLSDFDYHLPPELIAQTPLERRDSSRMLVVNRAAGRWEDRQFADFAQFIRPGDCLVLNDSRVIPSRLFGTRPESSGKIEVLLLEPTDTNANEWTALVRPGKKMRLGDQIVFGARCSAQVVGHGERGQRTLRFTGSDDAYRCMERFGHIPLPPYIKREDASSDRERYQTIYAAERGSVAAPTAGLHFTAEVLGQAQDQGAELAHVTLHVGLGTFQPLEAEHFEGHHLHRERYSVSAESWHKIEQAKRVVAVGTTSVRTVESVASRGERSGSTDMFIYPGYEFRKVGAMLTNFHLPRTSLLLLVSAFAGKELIQGAYRHAVEARYRFFSYGDCMLIV